MQIYHTTLYVKGINFIENSISNPISNSLSTKFTQEPNVSISIQPSNTGISARTLDTLRLSLPVYIRNELEKLYALPCAFSAIQKRNRTD